MNDKEFTEAEIAEFEEAGEIVNEELPEEKVVTEEDVKKKTGLLKAIIVLSIIAFVLLLVFDPFDNLRHSKEPKEEKDVPEYQQTTFARDIFEDSFEAMRNVKH